MRGQQSVGGKKSLWPREARSIGDFETVENEGVAPSGAATAPDSGCLPDLSYVVFPFSEKIKRLTHRE